MTAASCSLALSYYAKSVNFQPIIVQQVGLAVGSLGLTFGYGVGFGAVSYAMPGEILSPSDKTIGISIAQCVRMIATTVVIKVCISYCWNILILFTCRYIPSLLLLLATRVCLLVTPSALWQLACLWSCSYQRPGTRACLRFRHISRVNNTHFWDAISLDTGKLNEKKILDLDS